MKCILLIFTFAEFLNTFAMPETSIRLVLYDMNQLINVINFRPVVYIYSKNSPPT